MNDESSNSNDVIEISDDSCEAVYDGHAGASSSGMSFIKRPRDLSDDDDDDSDESDDVQFIEEESETEPEYECDHWDDDCVIVNTEITTKLIQGLHHTKYISLPESNDVKRMKLSIELNEILNDESLFKTMKENYLNDNAIVEKSYEVITDPWKVLVLNNLLADDSLLDKIRQEYNEIDWFIRTMDLYEFSQSEDIQNIDEEYISMFANFLKGDLMNWVAKLTGIELVEVSATCSYYSDTDFLLVHDDQRGTRAVAFVLYLTGKEGWCADWGGNLQLLNADNDKQPMQVTRNISPCNNQLILFPVTDSSYHQVEEVLCKNFCRLSINGWFHVKQPLTFDPPLYKPPVDGLYSLSYLEPSDEEHCLSNFIEEGYLENDTIISIQQYIEDNSEMSLEQFFREEEFNLYSEEIKSKDIKWKPMGPPNRRNYEYISDEAELPPKLKNLISMIKSKAFFACLNEYTGLDLKKMKWELQKWTTGSYSLITQENIDRLDVMFCMGDNNVVGGKTHYVTLEDEVQSALITTGCDLNYLNLVYGDTARFTSLLSKYSKTTGLYMFVASYFENNKENKKFSNEMVTEIVDLDSDVLVDSTSATTEELKQTPENNKQEGAGDGVDKEQNNIESAPTNENEDKPQSPKE